MNDQANANTDLLRSLRTFIEDGGIVAACVAMPRAHDDDPPAMHLVANIANVNIIRALLQDALDTLEHEDGPNNFLSA